MITINNINYFPIPDFKGYYISKDGQIYSERRKTILKQQTCKKGYKRISLMSDKGKVTFPVHRLVLRTFVGKSDQQIRHKNSNPADNRLENLAYCTAQENTNDKFYQNRKFQKLNAKMAIAIAQDTRDYKSIAKDYNITPSSVSDIKCGVVWNKVTEGFRYQRYKERTFKDTIKEQFTDDEIKFIIDKNNRREDICNKLNISLDRVKRIRHYFITNK